MLHAAFIKAIVLDALWYLLGRSGVSSYFSVSRKWRTSAEALSYSGAILRGSIGAVSGCAVGSALNLDIYDDG